MRMAVTAVSGVTDHVAFLFVSYVMCSDNDCHGYRLQPCMDGVKEPDAPARVVLVLVRRGDAGRDALVGPVSSRSRTDLGLSSLAKFPIKTQREGRDADEPIQRAGYKRPQIKSNLRAGRQWMPS